jgi:glycosyltransferase involved in cell wall biosynthesis
MGRYSRMKSKKALSIAILDFDHINNPLLAGGQARATYEVGKRLVALGHQVTVFCSKYPGYKDSAIDGITYKHTGFTTNNIRLNNLIYIFSIPFTVPWIKADVIVECFTAPISTLFSPLLTKIPVVALTSSFDAPRFSKLYHVPFDRIERFGLRFYKYALPLSAYYEDRIRAHNPGLIAKVVPEGVGKEFFAIKRKKAEHILFIGRFDVDQKGIDLLLTAYAKVKDTIGYPLVIAGVGPDEEKIRSTIKNLQLDSSVRLIGPAYGEKKTKLLENAAFVALPSRHETFSCFALEALAAGSPLVTFNIPGLRWLTGSVARKAEMFDTAAYAKQLLTMAEACRSTVLTDQARSFARQFTWERVADDFTEFFTEILRLEAQQKQRTPARVMKGAV